MGALRHYSVLQLLDLQYQKRTLHFSKINLLALATVHESKRLGILLNFLQGTQTPAIFSMHSLLLE